MKIEDFISARKLSDLWAEHLDKYYPWANYVLPAPFCKERPGVYTSITKGIFTWCDENLKNAYRKSGTWGNVSFFFSNKLDAIAFKLTFGDRVEKQEILNKKIAVRELNKRIKQNETD